MDGYGQAIIKYICMQYFIVGVDENNYYYE